MPTQKNKQKQMEALCLGTFAAPRDAKMADFWGFSIPPQIK